MDLKNMKVPIGIVVVIVAQAFGIIWYVAQLDSTVKSLDASVVTIQKSVADTDIAVLQTEVDNLKDQVAALAAIEKEHPRTIGGPESAEALIRTHLKELPEGSTINRRALQYE